MKRVEYPRPQFVRNDWLNLNGSWGFAFDDQDVGLKDKWFKESYELDQTIEVPFVFQSKLSGIDASDDHEIVWYEKTVEVPEEYSDKETILHFGAVDYSSEIFVNGYKVGSHIGGHTPFSINITPYLVEGKAHIKVRVIDPRKDETIPRGKQTWEDEPDFIWYTNTTGIWQTVWLEFLNPNHISEVFFTPDVDKGEVHIKTYLAGEYLDKKLSYKVYFKDELIISSSFDLLDSVHKVSFDIHQQKIFRTSNFVGGWHWTPETPNLFDVQVVLMDDDTVEDEVSTYFGMRKIHTEKGKIYLNNIPYYQKLVLDQGYWPGSLMTAPSDEAFKKDIELAKEMGFNGCRKHQKIEDPRFLYWADKLGYLVWGESASAHYFDESTVKLLANEWLEVVRRDYNHPSIVTWVPFNESWGINDVGRSEQLQKYTLSLYYMIQSLDSSRLVISNDGWELTKTDIVGFHHYGHGEIDDLEKYERFKETLKDKEGILSAGLSSRTESRPVFANGFSYENQPFMLTEFGGIGFQMDLQEGWGYSSVRNVDDYLTEYKRVLEAVYDSEAIWGFCYTQLYDVEQEINGILTYDRTPKAQPEQIKLINNLRYKHYLDK